MERQKKQNIAWALSVISEVCLTHYNCFECPLSINGQLDSCIFDNFCQHVVGTEVQNKIKELRKESYND